MDTGFIKFTKYLLDIMYFGGFVVLITLPATIKFLGKYYSSVITKNFALMLFVFGISGILGILIIGIVIMFIFKLFFVPTPATGIIILFFFIAALFSQVLADVFEKAVNYTLTYRTAVPAYSHKTDCAGNFCYWDMPPINSALLTQAMYLYIPNSFMC